MSLNALMDQTYLPEIEVLQSILSRYMQQWKGAATFEDRMLVEAEVISLFESLLDPEHSPHEVLVGLHPEATSWIEFTSRTNFLTRNGIARIRKLSDQYLKYFNHERMVLLELVGRLRRIKQKRATLNLRGELEAAFALVESFNTTENLSVTSSGVLPCTVDPVQGVLLLPVRQATPISISGVKIGKGSTGWPGNSDMEVQIGINSPEVMFDGAPDNWFEYERLDTGPCKLVLVCEFAQEQIVNQISIEPINLGNGFSFQVEDVSFIGENSSSVSLWTLVSGNLPRDTFVVKPIGNDTFWRINLLPVKAKAVAITLTQQDSYKIACSTAARQSVMRDRFAIAIKNIGFSRVEYEKEGGVVSSLLAIPSALHAVVPVVDCFPPGPLWDISLNVSSDGSETWSNNLLPGGPLSPSTHLMNGSETEFIWRATLTRDNAAFSSVTSIVEQDTKDIYSGTLRSVSRFQSPAVITLEQKPADGVVRVIQPKVMRRGERYTGVRLGEALGIEQALRVPVSILDYNVSPSEVEVMVGNRVWERVEKEEDLAIGTWMFTDDFKEVLITDGVAKGTPVTMILSEERGAFQEQGPAYYHEMDFPFDPEVESISVTVQDRISSEKTLILPRNQKVIKLPARNLHSNFSLVSDEDTVFTEVFTKTDLLDAEDEDYYLDRQNGILHLARNIANDNVRVSMTFSDSWQVENKDIEVVYKEGIPKGILISKLAIPANEHTDVVGDDPSNRINILTGIYEAREDLFGPSSPRKMLLSHDKIIKGSIRISSGMFGSTRGTEVNYIDGHTELLDLVYSTNEYTAETDTETSVVAFLLAAGVLVHESLGVSFSNTTIFGTIVGSVGAVNSSGEYFIDYDTGEVTVYVGPLGTLPSGIAINYAYRTPRSDRGLHYSVDYSNGIFYAGTEMEEGETITYKTAVVKISYDVALPVEEAVYDPDTNSVRIRTESLFEGNSNVKILWKKEVQSSLVTPLINYFTPMVHAIGFRFN